MSVPNQTRLHRWLWRMLAATVLLAMGHLVYVEDDSHRQRGPFALEVDLATRDSGSAQVFFDRGRGFRQEDSSSTSITGSSARVRIRFLLGLGTIRRLRLDYLNGFDSPATVSDLRIIDTSTGTIVRILPLADLRPNQQIDSYQIIGDVLHVAARPGADDPFLTATLDPPLQLGPTWIGRVLARSPSALALLLAFAAAAWVLDGLVEGRWRLGRIIAARESWRAGPRWRISAVAAVAVLLCCHPVIFAGRSLFSTGYGLALLHPEHLDAANATGVGTEDVNGSDIGAMLWQHLPYSVVQHHALVDEGTLPLWNRFNSCGSDLFGQGQSMLGDPFHLPVILAGGAAWAWDAKFVVARFLFALGVGFAAFAATRRFAPSALVTFCAPFLGFFGYRLNHPAYVTVCYSPWLLVAWFEIIRVADLRQAARWFALLVAANGCLLTSGTVKEAVMTGAVLNLVGLLGLLTSPQDRRLKSRLALAAVGLLLGGLLLTAPWWMAFAQAMASSWTAYDSPYALRIPMARLAGLFDGMLYSEFNAEHTVYAPSANLVVLLGLLLLIASGRRLRSDGPAVALLSGLFVALSLAFEAPWLPTSWILAVPGIRSVGHVGNTFSCVALPLLLVLAAQGFAAAGSAIPERAHLGRGAVVVALAGLLVVVLLRDLASPVFSSRTTTQAAWDALGEHAYFLRALAAAFAGWWLLAVAVRWMQPERARRGAGALLAVAALLPSLARHGQTLHAGHDEYFVNPAPRADLAAPSPALEWLKSRSSEPFRIVGVAGHVMPGFAAVHGLESPNGPDALVGRHYRELTEAAGLAPQADWYFRSEPADLAPRQRIMDMLNVRYYATCRESPRPPEWSQEIADLDLTIHESPSAWPRAFFTDAVATYSTPEALMELLAAGDGRPFAAVQDDQPVAGAGGSGLTVPRVVIPASGYRLGTQETEFTVAASGPGMIVLTEAWIPGAFEVSVDGRRTDMVRVNHAFKGIPITRAGTFRIRVVHVQPRATTSLILGLGGAGVTLGTLLWLNRGWRKPALTRTPGQTRSPEVTHG